jgi:hypothetical protein
MRNLPLALLTTASLFAIAPRIALADKAKAVLDTRAVALDAAMTETQCLDKAKEGMINAFKGTKSKVEIKPGSHNMTASNPSLVISVECLQYQNAKVAYIAAAATGSDPKAVAILTDTIRKALKGEK